MKNKLLFPLVLIAIIALVVLFYFVKPKNTAIYQQTTEEATVGQASLSASIESVKTFELVVKGKKLLSGPETLQVTEGDNVTIKITSNEDEELHLHGYDKSVEVQKDVPAQLTFVANLTGRFVYELENAKVEIGALEVSPK